MNAVCRLRFSNTTFRILDLFPSSVDRGGGGGGKMSASAANNNINIGPLKVQRKNMITLLFKNARKLHCIRKHKYE
jgi:hypothetical protein